MTPRKKPLKIYSPRGKNRVARVVRFQREHLAHIRAAARRKGISVNLYIEQVTLECAERDLARLRPRLIAPAV